MKKLLMLFAAVFAMSATSFAQVEAPTKETAPSVKMENKRLRTSKNTKQRPAKNRTASTPEARTGKIVDRINDRLTEKDPKLALTEKQRAQLVDIHMKRQLVQQSRPKLETEADKTAFMESRKAASKEFKKSIETVLTPAQNEVYKDAKRERRAMKANKKANKVEKKNKPVNNEKSSKF